MKVGVMNQEDFANHDCTPDLLREHGFSIEDNR